MKRLFLLLSSVIICAIQAMDTPSLPEVSIGSAISANSDLKIGAHNVYCKVGGQEFRLSDLLDNAIPIVGLQNQDIEKLKHDNLAIRLIVQECLTVVNQNGQAINANANIINEQTKVIKQHADLINHNSGAITTNANITNVHTEAIKNHASFINQHEMILNSAGIYIVAQHPIVKAIAAKCYSPEDAGLYLATLLVEGSSNKYLVDNPLVLLGVMIGAVFRTSSASGISALTSNVINRCGLDKYAQSELSKMATFVAARVAVQHLAQLMRVKCLQYIDKEKNSSAA